MVAIDEPFGAPSDALKAMYRMSNVLLEDGHDAAPHDPSRSGLLAISRGTAILLLLVYIAYLFFQVSAQLFRGTES